MGKFKKPTKIKKNNNKLKCKVITSKYKVDKIKNNLIVLNEYYNELNHYILKLKQEILELKIYIDKVLEYLLYLIYELSKLLKISRSFEVSKCQGYNCLFYNYELRSHGKFSESQQKYLCDLCFI
tara:strand:- start:14277 stop:14651 length:375 start_codon:yes stop_codon:yes gene_type:complete